MARTPWLLQDFSTGTEVNYAFPTNPNTFSPPGKSTNFAVQRPTAPNSSVILFQGLNDVASGQFSGVVRSQSEYEALASWTSKWYPVFLTDDRNNTWQVILTEVSWTRKHRYIDPDTYEYTVKFLELP